MTTFRIIAVAVLAVAGSATGEELAGDAGSPKVLARFRIGGDSPHLVLPVTMNGKTYPFLMDFGASHTTFDKSLEKLLGEPKNTLTVTTEEGQTHQASTYYAPDARLGPLDLRRGGPVYCVDLTELREVTGLDVRGVIGMGMLRRYVVQMDFDAREVRFYEADDREHPQWGEQIKMSSTPHATPLLMVGVGPKYNAVLMLDTGYMGTGTLPGGLFDQLVADGEITNLRKVTLGSARGEVQSQAGRLSTLQAGDLNYKNLIFERGGRYGMLGLGFLSRHTVTIDSPGNRAYLKPGREFQRADENDMSGLHLLAKPDGVTVHSVDAESPAAQAGLTEGDVLLQVAGNKTAEVSLAEIRRVLRSEPGKKIDVILLRDGKKYRASFTLRRLL